MPWRYASTFPTGFEDLIPQVLESFDHQVSIELIQDGLVIFNSHLEAEEIRRIPCFNNSFLCLALKKFKPTTKTEVVTDELFRQTELRSIMEVIQKLNLKSFRLMVSKENETRSMPPNQRQTLEMIVSKILKLKVDRLLPDTELWFFFRRDGMGFNGFRLTKREKAGKGELGKEVAYLLNFMSSPKSDDTFLDPFAGTGAIPLSRVNDFPYKEVIVCDIDKKKVDEITLRFKKFRSTKILQANALQLAGLADGSVDVVVTDPPWGFFEEIQGGVDDFYVKMIKEIRRVLKSGSRAVLITARKEEFSKALGQIGWRIEKMLNVLISGKKTGVYLLVKSR